MIYKRAADNPAPFLCITIALVIAINITIETWKEK